MGKAARVGIIVVSALVGIAVGVVLWKSSLFSSGGGESQEGLDVADNENTGTKEPIVEEDDAKEQTTDGQEPIVPEGENQATTLKTDAIDDDLDNDATLPDGVETEQGETEQGTAATINDLENIIATVTPDNVPAGETEQGTAATINDLENIIATVTPDNVPAGPLKVSESEIVGLAKTPLEDTVIVNAGEFEPRATGIKTVKVFWDVYDIAVYLHKESASDGFCSGTVVDAMCKDNNGLFLRLKTLRTITESELMSAFEDALNDVKADAQDIKLLSEAVDGKLNSIKDGTFITIYIEPRGVFIASSTTAVGPIISDSLGCSLATVYLKTDNDVNVSPHLGKTLEKDLGKKC